MKQLILLRHAEAKSSSFVLSDFVRPLTKKGENDAKRMAQLLRKLQLKIDAFYTSSAIRAKQTAHIIAKVIQYPISRVVEFSLLYQADDWVLNETLVQVPSHVNTLVLVAHNPGLTQLVNQLLKSNTYHLEPASLIVISIKKEWNEILNATCECIFQACPTKLK